MTLWMASTAEFRVLAIQADLTVLVKQVVPGGVIVTNY